MGCVGCYACDLSKLCYKCVTDIWKRLSCPLHWTHTNSHTVYQQWAQSLEAKAVTAVIPFLWMTFAWHKSTWIDRKYSHDVHMLRSLLWCTYTSGYTLHEVHATCRGAQGLHGQAMYVYTYLLLQVIIFTLVKGGLVRWWVSCFYSTHHADILLRVTPWNNICYESDMALAMSHYTGNSILPLIIILHSTVRLRVMPTYWMPLFTQYIGCPKTECLPRVGEKLCQTSLWHLPGKYN
jgi:hypothetical protein